MALFLNGLPLVTMELKNSLTGQMVTDAEKQYRTDRDPREPLFQFRRCLVHFAVGNEKVSMTTHLQGGGHDSFRLIRGRKSGEPGRSQDHLPVGGHPTAR